MTVLYNSLANYAGRFYVILAGILILPLFLEYLGDEAYGLIGLFTLVQSVISLLNFGLSPTLGREAARSKVKPDGYERFGKILRSYELIILCICLMLATTAMIFSRDHASLWLRFDKLETDVVATAVFLLCAAAIFRFAQTLYRSAIMGLEEQVWINVVDIVFATLRYVVALLLVIYVSDSVVVYFAYQLIVSALEFLLIRHRLVNRMPRESFPQLRYYHEAACTTYPFAAGIAYTAGIWVLITQIDKMILSGILPLEEFGYYSLVALVAAGLLQVSQPISIALRPRFTSLLAQNKEREMLELYHLGTQVVTVISIPAAWVIAFNSEALIYAWTGNLIAAQWAAKPLFWFILGNAILTVGAFQYFLQFAHGKLNLHVWGSTISACVQIPVLAYAANFYGAYGAAIAWFAVRLLFFIAWVPIVHQQLAPGIHKSWLSQDILPIVLVSFICVLVYQAVFGVAQLDSRIETMTYLITQGLTVFVISLFLAASKARLQLLNLIRAKIGRRIND